MGSNHSSPHGAACGVDSALGHPLQLACKWLCFALVVSLEVSLTCVERRQKHESIDVLILTCH